MTPNINSQTTDTFAKDGPWDPGRASPVNPAEAEKVREALQYGRWQATSNAPVRAVEALTALDSLVAELASLKDALEKSRDGLRAIAEGNLGGDPWEADYRRIKEFASHALAASRVSLGER